MTDIEFMELALGLAAEAGELDEVPVGAVIVRDGMVIARARNSNRSDNCATRHAEMIAIEQASRILGNERLVGCGLFVTKEPCAMCAGAIVHARIERLVIGARDRKYGACGTVLDVCGNALLNHVPAIEFGLLEERSVGLLQNFFKKKRER
ncbi:MAG TPA: nucleoside deaminase [Spirochaetota bacterium]|nr:nucleoside deaminase [Spirochaetota bacterium]